MRALLLLPLLFLQVHPLLTPPKRPYQLSSPHPPSGQDPLRTLVRERLALYKEELTASLSSFLGDDEGPFEGPFEGPSRTKRATITADNPMLLGRRRRKIANPLAEKGTYVVTKSYRVTPSYFDTFKCLDLNSLTYKNETYLFALEELSAGRQEVCVYKVNSGLSLEEMWRLEVPGATLVEVVEISKNYYILPLVPWAGTPNDIDIGSNLYRIDFHRRYFRKVQTIKTAHARSCAFWKASGEEANDVFLGVAPEFAEQRGDYEAGESYRVEVRVFRWQGGYFDYVSSVPASNPHSITFFNIHSFHYLAIANFQDHTGSTTLHSEIFRYQHKDSRFVPFQRIRTSGAKDIKHFSFGNGLHVEHFLAVANNCETDEYGNRNYNVKSFIMKLSSQRFILFKSFPTYGAVEFLPVTLGDKFFLLLADMKGLKIFQYNGWSFVQTYEDPLPNHGYPIHSIKLRSLVYQDQPFYTVSSNATSFQSGIYSVQMTLKDDYSKMTLDLEKWCIAAKKQADSVDFPKFTQRFLTAPKTTAQTSITFRHPLTFAGHLSVNHVQATTLHFNRTTFDSPLAQSLVAQHLQSSQLAIDVLKAIRGVSNVAFLHGTHVFTGPVKMSSGLFYSNPHLPVNHLQINDTLNGHNVNALLPNVILRHKDYSLPSLHLNHAKFSGEIRPGRLNGVDVSDYALLTAHRVTFTHTNTFLKQVTFTADLNVTRGGVFGGLRFSQPPNFLLARGNQTFPDIHVENSHASHLHTKFVNGHEVDYFYDEAVRLDEDVQITGAKEWSDVIVNSDLTLQGLLNGRHLPRLMSTAVTLTKDSQRLRGTTHFQDVKAEFIVLPGGPKVNKPPINLLTDLVSTEGSLPPHHFTSITLEEDAAVDSLTATRSLNHIRVLDNNTLDIFTRDSLTPQLLKSKSFLEDVEVTGNIRADSLVDGVDLKNWSGSRRILLNDSTVVRKVLINGNLITPHTLKVRRNLKLGQQEILPVLRHAALLSALRLPSNCAVHFHSLNVHANTLLLKDLNGIKPHDSWVRSDDRPRAQVNVSGVTWIHGDVYLNQHAHSNGLYARESPQNLLQVLPYLLIDGEEQTIPGDVVFPHLLRADEASCPETTLEGGVPFASLLTTSTPQTILVQSSLKGPIRVQDSLHISSNILSVPLVNNVSLHDTIKDTLFKARDVPQVIQGQWKVHGDLDASEVETDGYVNSIDLNKFLRSLVLTNHSGPLNLYANVFLLEEGAEVTSIHLDNDSLINDLLHGGHWGSNSLWLLKTGDQTVFTPLHFSGGSLKVDSPLVSPYSSKVHLEGHETPVDIQELNKTFIRRHLGGTLQGTTLFQNNVVVETKVDLGPSALVNGKALLSSAVLRNRTHLLPLILDKERVFTNGVDILGNLYLKGKVDNVDINPAMRFLYPDNAYPSNESLLVTGNLQLKVEPHVRRTVNDVNLNELLQNVWFTDSHAILPHPVTFHHASFKNHTPLLTGPPGHPLLISNIDVRDILDNYASKEKDQVWTGSVTFDSVTFNRLNTPNITIDDALFNGVDVETFATSILLNGTDQQLSGNWKFTQLYANHIEGHQSVVTINGMNVISDFMRLHAPHGNKVTGHKTITDELDVEELLLTHNDSIHVGGVDIEAWHSGSVKSHGDHVLAGPLSLHDFYGNLRVVGLVDGVRVDAEHILLKRGAQEIPGKMVIDIPNEGLPNTAAALTAPQGIHLNGLFNEYNLNDTFGHLVRKSEGSSEPLVIYGEKMFAAPIYVTQVVTKQLFHGRNLTQLFHDFYSGLAIPRDLHFRAQDKYSLLQDFTQQIAASHASKQAVFLEFFVLNQEIVHSRSPKSSVAYVEPLFGLRSLTLAVGVENSSVTIDTWWSYDFNSDLYLQSALHSLRISGQVVSYKEIDSEAEHYVLIGVESPKGSYRSAQLSSDIQRSPSYVETNKAPGRKSKTFILKQEPPTANSTGTFVLTQVISAAGFGPLQTFQDSTGPISDCFLISPSDSKAQILCPSTSGTFTPLQTLPLTSISLTTSMEGLGRTFLIIVPGDSSSAQVWTSTPDSLTFTNSSCIPLFSAVSLDSIFGSNHIPFLAVASSGPSGGFVSLYKYSPDLDTFLKTQTLDIPAPLQVKFIRMEPSTEVFLFILSVSPKHNLLVFKYKGLNGWVLEHKWTTQHDARLLQVFDFSFHEDDSHYLTQILVSSPTSTRIYSATFKGLPNSSSKVQAPPY